MAIVGMIRQAMSSQTTCWMKSAWITPFFSETTQRAAKAVIWTSLFPFGLFQFTIGTMITRGLAGL
jgi:hypothetical protein